ncbi:hypothetical protein SK128_016883 [Halocaridina rubra]|uniref:Uncharacterized protein n=1 Tax=Halocaridina rubra TaxID=373956 RepID=A0AAN8XFS6_HALRR
MTLESKAVKRHYLLTGSHMAEWLRMIQLSNPQHWTWRMGGVCVYCKTNTPNARVMFLNPLTFIFSGLCNSSIPPLIHPDGSIPCSPTDKANFFAAYFSANSSVTLRIGKYRTIHADDMYLEKDIWTSLEVELSGLRLS